MSRSGPGGHAGNDEALASRHARGVPAAVLLLYLAACPSVAAL